jgi:hypothetical protein
MFLRSIAQKGCLFLIATLLLVTTGKDWSDFYTCGAVGQCLSDAGVLQLYTKFAMSFLLTALAFMVASKAFSPRDAKLLRVAFVFSLLADFSFSKLKILVPDAVSMSTVFGIVFFMAFQTVLIYRHSRKSEADSNIPKVYWLLAAVTLAAAILFATGVVGLTVATVLAYAAFVISSTVVGILAPGKGYYPAPNASLIRWGMVIFFFGDVLVGLAMLSGEDHSAVQTIAEVANNFIWWVYVPAQLMLIRGAVKSGA